MALSSSQGLFTNLQKGYAVSQVSEWQTLGDGTNGLVITSVDTTNLTNPSALITSKLTTSPDTAPGTSRVVLADPGTNLILRLKYATGATAITDPVVKVFGVDKNKKFHFLKNLSGSASITLVTKASDDGDTDVRDGTFRYTDIDSSVILDLQGSKYFIVVVSTALAGTNISTTARVEYKIV